MGGRGAFSASGRAKLNDASHINGKDIFKDELTLEEATEAYNRALQAINDEMEEEARQLDVVQQKIDEWIADKKSTYHLDSVTREDGNIENIYLEKATKKEIVNDYIKEYNAGWTDDDTSIHILYKDGTYASSFDSDKLKTTNIESVIVNGSWGTTFTGKIKVTHDTPEMKWNVVKGGGKAMKLTNGGIKRLPQYKGFMATWNVEFE